MNGVAFADLPQLVRVDLTDNACISKAFEVERGSRQFRRKISRSCGSADVVKKQLSCTSSTACDEVENSTLCCELDLDTRVDASDYTFTTDPRYKTLEILIIAHQSNVEFLPVLVHERFPGLKHYLVKNTPVTKISKKNFEKMFKLETLNLDRNDIEVIKSDTFEDLVNLKLIALCEYKAAFSF